MRILWTGVIAIVMTALVSVWAGLLPTNLAHSPGLAQGLLFGALSLWALNRLAKLPR